MSGKSMSGKPMAARKKKKTKLEVKLCHSFNGEVNKSTLGASVMELLKHLLFFRNQLPMPLSMLKGMSSEQNIPKQPLRSGMQIRTSRKEKCVKNMSVILAAVTEIFNRYKVRKIVLMFGSTVVSPRETFLILCDSVTCLNNDENNPDLINGSMVRKFLRKIVVNEHFNGLSSITPQNIHFLVSLNDLYEMNESLSNIFCPKLNYQLPSRGTTHILHLCAPDYVCQEMCPVIQSSDLSKLESQKDYWFIAQPSVKGFKEI